MNELCSRVVEQSETNAGDLGGAAIPIGYLMTIKFIVELLASIKYS